MQLAAVSKLIPNEPKGNKCEDKSHFVQSNLALAQVRNTRFSLVSKPQTKENPPSYNCFKGNLVIYLVSALFETNK